MHPPTLRVDLAAVRHNVGEWRRFIAGRELWAVVKSNAYGLGAIDVSRACLAAGAARLCIVDLAEARELRDAGIAAPIVHLTATPPSEFFAALDLDVQVSLEDWRGAQTLDEIAQRRKRTAAAHLAIDTGTGWSGVAAASVKAFAKQASALRHLRWEGVWTHIAGADTLREQIAGFNRAVSILSDAGIEFAHRHIAGTAATILGAPGDAVRIGIGLYGSTLGEATLLLDLKTAVELRAAVAYVKRFDAATRLGYGSRASAEAGDIIATLRLGYADGLPSGLANHGVVYFDAEPARIVGAIGMNFTMVKVPDGLQVKVGDEALVVGDDDGIRLDDVARAAGMIPHELCTALGNCRALPPLRPA